MYVGGSEARRRRAQCKNSNTKGASFFCACWWGRMEVPAAPTFGGLVGLRPSEATEGGLWHHQQRHAAQDCML
jgi:hypothetical protein